MNIQWDTGMSRKPIRQCERLEGVNLLKVAAAATKTANTFCGIRALIRPLNDGKFMCYAASLRSRSLSASAPNARGLLSPNDICAVMPSNVFEKSVHLIWIISCISDGKSGVQCTEKRFILCRSC